MAKPVQKRTLETRARLIAVADDLVTQSGFDALRVDDVVQRAGVAKGTFFAHFKDKDSLMDLLVGARINACLDQIAATPAPQSVEDLCSALMPLLTFMTCERYVFDVILRHSGAAAIEDIGVIAMTFERHSQVMARWLADGPFRQDVSAMILAEGIQAFSFQAMALNFCALNGRAPLQERLLPYLKAWLLVPEMT